MKVIFRICLLTVSLVCTALFATEPVLYIPFDDSADVIGAKGEKISAGIVHGRAGYQPGVIGKALDVKRHAYDQVTAVTFTDLPAMDCNNGTVAFWFQPHWKESDPEAPRILSGRDARWKGFRFYILKNPKGQIELSVLAPKQVQILKKDLLKAAEWTHIAFSWEQAKGEVKLYINGREVASRAVNGAFQRFEAPIKINLYCGKEDTDRFKAEVGDGLYDEIKIFDRILSAPEIFQLASASTKKEMKELSLDAAIRDNDGIMFALRNREGHLLGPQTLLVLSTANPKQKLTFSTMGASGKLAMLAEADGKICTVETAYTLNLENSHKITLRRNGKSLEFLLDDALQGKVELPNPFGKIIRAEAPEGVSLLAPTAVPSQEEQARLTNSIVHPVEKPLWDIADAQRFREGARNGVSLNGYWRVIPVNDYSYAPPSVEWGYMRVPGSFRSPLWQIYRIAGDKLESANGQWNKQPLIRYRAGWYQRIFEVPADLRQAGRVYLNFTNLNGDNGRIYLNGKLIDEFRQDFKSFPVVPNARRLDVTELLEKDNVLTLFIDRHYVGLWRGQPSIGDHGEIALDDVWLESAPSKLSLKSTLALPSFRKQEVTMRARIQNPSGEKGDVSVRFDFRREGNLERSFTTQLALDGSPEQLVVFTGTWANPVLWDVETPNLYRMSTALIQKGRDIDTFPTKDFGFREAWVENGEFRMNGRKMRMRMWTCVGLNRLRYYYGNSRAIGQYVAHIKEMNYDTIRFEPFDKTSQVCWESYLNESDRQGLYNLFPMPPYEDEELSVYSKEISRFLEQYGNHPSILMWYTDFNTCSYSWNQDPAKLNDIKYVPLGKIRQRKRVAVAESVMREIDRTREIFQHAGGNSGKIFGSMNYQSFGVPLQEQEDWPKQWAQSHIQPLMVVECGFPYPMR